MKYDFETLVNRKGTGSSKWGWMYEALPNAGEDVVPLSVADMELKNPPAIIEGLKSYQMNLNSIWTVLEFLKSIPEKDIIKVPTKGN